MREHRLRIHILARRLALGLGRTRTTVSVVALHLFKFSDGLRHSKYTNKLTSAQFLQNFQSPSLLVLSLVKKRLGTMEPGGLSSMSTLSSGDYTYIHTDIHANAQT